jgi:creatinine amidohydrolase/Fe(II)-dependent formamide hydrolase-like protein
MYWGAFHTLRFPLTFHFSRWALRRQVRRTLESLADWGFRSIVLLTGHYPVAQLSMLRRECRRVAARRNLGALGLSEAMLTADIGYIGDHAAKWETSLLMALEPALVDLSRLPEDTGTLDERFALHGIDGVCPRRHASADEGRRALEVIVDRLAEAASRMAKEGNADAAEAIYAAHARVFRRPIAAAKTAFGTDSAREALIHVAKSVWRNRHL